MARHVPSRYGGRRSRHHSQEDEPMRIKAVCVTFLLFLGMAKPAVNAENPYGRKFARQTVGRAPLASAAVSATVQQARKSPHEWGGGIGGFGKRFGSSLGK